jgi:predicted nuclease of predicted toxin-antitoxin system
MKYVFDECIPDRIPKALNVLGKDCEPYFHRWEKGAPDTEWIPLASSRGWCIVTADVLRRPHEREALRHHQARVVVFGTTNLRFWDQVVLIIRRWEDVEKATERRKPPYILRFTSRSRKPQELA